MASEIRVNKIENRSGLGTVTFADTGVDLAGIVTATTFSGSGASLTNLPSSALTGALPAIDGSALTGVSSQKADGCVTENSLTISNNYTMTTNKSGISAGDIIIASGVTVTIPSGSRYVIV